MSSFSGLSPDFRTRIIYSNNIYMLLYSYLYTCIYIYIHIRMSPLMIHHWSEHFTASVPSGLKSVLVTSWIAVEALPSAKRSLVDLENFRRGNWQESRCFIFPNMVVCLSLNINVKSILWMIRCWACSAAAFCPILGYRLRILRQSHVGKPWP